MVRRFLFAVILAALAFAAHDSNTTAPVAPNTATMDRAAAV
jgi:hypothetical protein